MTRALIVSGGGSKGAFAVGAVKFLMTDRGRSYDILAGTSTGSLIATLIAADGVDALPTLEREYTTARDNSIIEERDPPAAILSASSVFTSRGLQSRISELITDALFHRLQAAPRTLILATVELESGRLVYWFTGPRPLVPATGEARRIEDRGTLMRAMLASASVPVAMPPVEIHGNTFVDGGVREYAPIEVAADVGAEEIDAVLLSPISDAKPRGVPPFDRLMKVGRRALDLLLDESGEADIRAARVFTDARRYLDDLGSILERDHGFTAEQVDRLFRSVGTPLLGRRAAELRIIRPEVLLAGDSLAFDAATMRANLALGFDRAGSVWMDGPMYAAATA